MAQVRLRSAAMQEGVRLRKRFVASSEAEVASSRFGQSEKKG
jgi:hypothetical protein